MVKVTFEKGLEIFGRLGKLAKSKWYTVFIRELPENLSKGTVHVEYRLDDLYYGTEERKLKLQDATKRFFDDVEKILDKR